MFFYEKWDVFQAALRLRRIAGLLSQYRVPGAAEDLNQLRRNTSSIVLNISEGAKEPHLGKKLDRYGSAHGSAGEANSSFLILRPMFPESSASLFEEGREVADRVSAMMTNLIRSVSKNWNDPTSRPARPPKDSEDPPPPPPPPPDQ